MNIKTTNEITNGVYTTTITAVDFGYDMLSSEEELNILNNYSCKLKYKDLDFVGKFKVIDGEVMMTEDEDGSDIEIAVSDMIIPINKDFKAEYKVAVNKIKDEEVNDILASKEMICEAKCILFTTVVKNALASILEEVRNKATNFEGTTEEMI
jgi:hypothetical protein